MKCHYEILGVSRDADDSEIKTAYRKLALRWHPDKNLDDSERAKKQFQLVQQAYEVLSDPFERAWYDNHREQILRGKYSDYTDTCLDVFQYFTVSCFKGYGDDPEGFYHVYGDVFKKISAEDFEFMDEENFDKIPRFGYSQDDYETVVGPFYAYWQSYTTKKSYSWLCPYNISEIKDRRILREIEKEMKKIVQKAKRERNEEVRNLVSFVRKRDKRVQAYKNYLEEKAETNRQKQLQNRLEQIRKRKEEIEELSKTQNSNLNKDYEEQLKMLEQEYTDTEDEYGESDDNDLDESAENLLIESTENLELNDVEWYEENVYCAVCNKEFRNVNAFKNHEVSKKHRENIEKLKKEMIDEDKLYEEEYKNTSTDENSSPEVHDTENDCQESLNSNKENKSSQNKSNKKSKKSKRNKITENLCDNNDDDEEIENNIINIVGNLSDKEDKNWDDNRKSNKKTKAKKINQQKNSKTNQSTDSKTIEIESTTATAIAEDKDTTVPPSSTHTGQKTKKESPKDSISNGIDVDHVCVTCKSSFDSKNKLFHHLKKTNHGVYIPKQQSATATTVNDATTNRKKKNRK